jgi:hypothetical protein
VEASIVNFFHNDLPVLVYITHVANFNLFSGPISIFLRIDLEFWFVCNVIFTAIPYGRYQYRYLPLVILMVVCVQFVYCCLVGTFPFNAFLSGFISCVASFVLGVCLRLQVSQSTFSSQIPVVSFPFITVTL